jgi:hypothetical protein
MGNNVKPGVLCISLLEHVIGEDWDVTIEGTKFFVPYSADNSGIVRSLCDHINNIGRATYTESEEWFEHPTREYNRYIILEAHMEEAPTLSAAKYACKFALKFDEGWNEWATFVVYVIDKPITEKKLIATFDVFNENDISRHLYNLVEDYLSKIREIWGPPSKYSPNLLLSRTSLVDKASDGTY